MSILDLNNTLKAISSLSKLEMMDIIIKLNAKNKKLENKNRELKQSIKDEKEYTELLQNQVYDLCFIPVMRPIKEEK